MSLLAVQVPYLKHGEHKVSDSTFMIKYLRATYGDAVKIKQPSNPTDAAVALALQRMIEEHLRWFGVYHRWSSEQARLHPSTQWTAPHCVLDTAEQA